MSIRTVSDASYSAKSLNMLPLRSIKTINIGGDEIRSQSGRFFRVTRTLHVLKILCGTILTSIILIRHSVFKN